MTTSLSLPRRVAAEALGTSLLLAVVVGSGIMAERLADGQPALALLANALATGTGLAVLILVFAPISGAHFNPLVTLAARSRSRERGTATLSCIGAQVIGAFGGVALAHAMFAEPIFSLGTKPRAGANLWLGELVATFGLFAVIHATRRQARVAPWAIGAYITAGYWFTSSTSFANPAVTLARAATTTFTGIRPIDVPGFIVAQLIGAALAVGFFHWLDPEPERETHEPR